MEQIRMNQKSFCRYYLEWSRRLDGDLTEDDILGLLHKESRLSVGKKLDQKLMNIMEKQHTSQ